MLFTCLREGGSVSVGGCGESRMNMMNGGGGGGGGYGGDESGTPSSSSTTPISATTSPYNNNNNNGVSIVKCDSSPPSNNNGPLHIPAKRPLPPSGGTPNPPANCSLAYGPTPTSGKKSFSYETANLCSLLSRSGFFHEIPFFLDK